MGTAVFGGSILKRFSMMGVAAVTAGAILATVAPVASAAPINSRPIQSAAATAQQGASLDQALVDQLVSSINAAKGTLEAGQSKVVYADGESTLTIAKGVDGKFTLTGTATPHRVQPSGFCHWSAMAAVYTIGAAAFAAAALTGGITIVGIAISAEAAGAMSAALTAGAGVSALVSEYIC